MLLGDGSKLLIFDDATTAPEIQFVSFPSSTSLRVQLSQVPAGAGSIQMLFREWKWQSVVAWTVFSTIDSPTQGQEVTYTGLTAGTIYQFTTRAFTGANALGTPSHTGNDPRWMIILGRTIEYTVDAIQTLLESDLATQQAVVTAAHGDSLSFPEIEKYYDYDHDRDHLGVGPSCLIVGIESDKEDFTGSRKLWEHSIVIKVVLSSDATQANYKNQLRRYNEAIELVLADYPTLGGMAYRFSIEDVLIVEEIDGNNMRAHSELPLLVETFE